MECEAFSHLPHRVEKHRDDEGLREVEREALRGDRAGDDVPSLEVAGQGLKQIFIEMLTKCLGGLLQTSKLPHSSFQYIRI